MAVVGLGRRTDPVATRAFCLEPRTWLCHSKPPPLVITGKIIIQLKNTTQRPNGRHKQHVQDVYFLHLKSTVPSDLINWIQPSGSEPKDPIDLHRSEIAPRYRTPAGNEMWVYALEGQSLFCFWKISRSNWAAGMSMASWQSLHVCGAH